MFGVCVKWIAWVSEILFSFFLSLAWEDVSVSESGMCWRGNLFCNPLSFFFIKCHITFPEMGMEMSAICLPQRVTALLYSALLCSALLCSALAGGL